MMISFNRRSSLLIAVIALFALCGNIHAAKKVHGVSIFGPESLKYKEGEPFNYLHPDAPIAGTLRIATDAFTKVTFFGLIGNPPRLLEFCFDTIGIKSWDDDEPYACYGLVAEHFEIADDKKSMTIYLRKEARFSDGVPLTADDVVFSYNLMYDPDVTPSWRLRWRKIDKLVKVDRHTVKVYFKEFARDVPIAVCRLIIFPKHIYGVPGKNIGTDFRDALPVGSGPYKVESYIKGQQIVYKRRDDYWAQKLPYCNGYLNFDRLDLQVYYDEFSKGVALRSDLLDFGLTDGNAQEFQKFTGDYFDKNYIVKSKFPLTRPSAMKAMVFNLRDPVLSDIRVRRVIASLYNFDQINKNYFANSQERLVSYFHRQKHLRAASAPAEGAVKELLESLAEKYNDPAAGAIHVPVEAITKGPREMGTYPDGTRMPIEERVHAANIYLDQIGWKWDPEAGTRRKGDLLLNLEIMDHYPGIYRFTEALRMAGIKASQAKLGRVEARIRMKNFDFKMRHRWMDARNAPGREFAKHLLSAEADISGSHNVMGVKNPAVDELLELVMKAETKDAVSLYSRALDRILCAQCYVVPKYWPTCDFGCYWNRFGRPDEYASGLWLYYNILWFWWYDAEKDASLKAAMGAGITLEDK